MVKIHMIYEYDLNLDNEYTSVEVAEILNVSNSYLQRLLRHGKLKYLHKASTRSGGHIITGKMIVEYLVNHKLSDGYLKEIKDYNKA